MINLIHRTKIENRKSILERGLIPQYKKSESCCPIMKGYVSASIGIGYFRKIDTKKLDYWKINSTEFKHCEPECLKRDKPLRCKWAVKIKGPIKPKDLKLCTELELQ